jgi:cell division protein FtsL
MMKTLNVLAVIALIGSAIAAYSVKYETILMAEKLKKRQAERTREQQAVAVLQAEWNLLNRPARLEKIAMPEAGMQVLNVRQIVRAIDIPHAGADVDTIAKALDGTLTGSLVTPDATRKSTGRTPGAPMAASPVAPARPRVAAAPLPLTSSASAPLSLTPRAAPPKAASAPKAAAAPQAALQAITAPPRPPARVPGVVPQPATGAVKNRAGER